MFTQLNPTHTAQALYDRAQGNSDVLISKRAREIAADLRKAIPTDDAQAAEVGTEMLGWLDGVAELSRLTAAGDAPGLLALLKPVHDKAVAKVAEYRAIDEFEALTPTDFLPD
ncbi:MAG TPA: hypothetical protein VM406_16435 [Noviherbaspirillum sp.]|nr:hypothetical protein [Noviherbaspirillum sp.]